MAKKERKYIKIRGASEHNLKCVSLDIPRDEFVVFTGLSGSGKSSLAFDTIYAESAQPGSAGGHTRGIPRSHFHLMRVSF